MKKVLFASAFAAALIAAGDGIESSNIVGYNTQAIAGGELTCASFQFTDIVSPTLATFENISTANLTPGVYEGMEEAAPCIMIYNGRGYDFYYYISDADDGTERFDLTGWADAGGNLAGAVAIPSTGFWLQIPTDKCAAGSLTEAGQVLASDTATVDVAAGLTLAGNPYPTALNFEKIVTTGIVPGVYEGMEEDAPCLMIYNGRGYDFYYYISDADDGTERFDLTGWADAGGNLVTEVAPAGTGFWIDTKTSGAGTLTFSL